MLMKPNYLFKFMAVFAILTCQSICFAQVFDGRTLKPTSLSTHLSHIEAGSIVIIGENHNQEIHQQQQLEVMRILRSLGHNVHTGLEFIYYPDQEKLEKYRLGVLPEEQFLKEISWGGDDFSLYRDQVLFPNPKEGEHAWALNLPRSITGKIAKSGLESLETNERNLLPPNFSLGRSVYKDRFMESMPHLDPNKAENYFISQSAWDDTMAWRALETMKQFPRSVLVIISGDFHVAFGGGLPDRLKARGFKKIFTISQFNSEGLDSSQILDEISPSKGDIRADLIWIEDLSKPAQKMNQFHF